MDNLIGNAIKFTPAGGTIGVRVFSNGSFVVLRVSDTGIGIARDKLDRIFDRFYQVDGSESRRYGGVGLGLALVKQVAEAYGGSVDVESEEGVGSSFTVSLPVWT
jgi:signal transduction histidine kinase